MDTKVLQGYVEDAISLYSRLSGIDAVSIAEQIRSNCHEFKGTLTEFAMRDDLRKAMEYYLEGDLECSYYQLVSSLKSMTSTVKYNNTDDIDKIIDIFQNLKQIISRFEELSSDIKERVDSELSSFPLYKPGEEQDYDPRYYHNIRKSLNSNLLDLYSMRLSGIKPDGDKFVIKDTIVACDSLDTIMNIKGNKGVWTIQVGLYIERKIDLSYFVIMFENNGNVFVLTDKPHYENPDQMDMLRGGGRRFQEDRERYIELPYGMIDKIIEMRNESTSIAKDAGQEIYTFPLKDWFYSNLYWYIKYSIIKFKTETITPLLQCSQLAIGTGNIDLNDDSTFIERNEEFEELMDELFYKSNLPAIKAKEFVEYLPTMITEKEFDRDVKYLAHKRLAEEQESFKYAGRECDGSNDRRYDIYEEDKKIMAEMFKDAIKNDDTLYRIMFSGDLVYLYDTEHEIYDTIGFSNKKAGKEKRLDWVFCRTSEGWADLAIRNVSKITYNEVCNECGCNNKRIPYREMNFERYTEFLAILGITRDELPPMFRYYLGNRYMPYGGNSILRNVKPEYVMIEHDFMSKRFPNKYTVSLPFCKKCIRDMIKKYRVGKNSVVVIGGGKVIDIVDYDKFNKEDYI